MEQYKWNEGKIGYPSREAWFLPLEKNNGKWKDTKSLDFQVYLVLSDSNKEGLGLKNYSGEIDKELEIIFPSGFDTDPLGSIFFHEGDIKYNSLSGGCPDKYANAKEVLKFLDTCPGTENLGTSLKSIILDSNLSQKQRDSVKCLTE